MKVPHAAQRFLALQSGEHVNALNWTSRSAMVKDYRHDVVLAKE